MAHDNIIQMRRAPVAKRSRMDTLVITHAVVNAFHHPPFQRPLRVNPKVLAIAEQIKADGGVIPGTITLGELKNRTYIVDGQHRLEAYKISEVPEALADVRILTFESMGEMADEFVNLNSQLVKMSPDDILRGLEESLPLLRRIRNQCQFVGYGQLRRGDEKSPVLSMSATVRAWIGSTSDTPGGITTSSMLLAQQLTEESTNELIEFLNNTFAAWGRGPDSYRLWGTLTLTLTMWMWRRLVLDTERRGAKRFIVLKREQFKRCLMSVAADADYSDWLPGRKLSERDRSPAYQRLRKIFLTRLHADGVSGTKLPSPPWYTGRGGT
jgi:hypothetical protein